MKIPGLPNFRNLLPKFSEALHDNRTLRGLSIEQVAEKSGISADALREMEAGTRQPPSASVVKAIAEAIGISGAAKGDFISAAEINSPAMSAFLGQILEKPEEKALPAAILVFLIADIRGYTSYTQRRGDEAAARLSTTFAEMARSVALQRDGRLVETRGDEVLCVFASAKQAVRAAGELQARYTAEADAHPDIPPGIGAGLDLGEAVPVEGGFRGAALNRAARLCSLAGAGEVLVSPGIVYVAPQVEGVQFVPRGQEYLKGFAEPVQIVEAKTGGIIEAAFPSATDED